MALRDRKGPLRRGGPVAAGVDLRVMPDTFTVEFDGGLLRRGFSLYVFDVTCPDGEHVHYVGMTGSRSGVPPQSLLWRMATNVTGHSAKLRQVEQYLVKRGIDPTACKFRFIGHGPILDGAVEGGRKQVLALEKQLAEDLKAAAYDVMNTVTSTGPLDAELYAPVRAAFAAEFPNL